MAAQGWRDFEWIVVDGRSEDGTLDAVSNGTQRVMHLISEPDEGIYDAWNKGIARSSGDWISFLGAGDIYRPGALGDYAEWISSQQRASPAAVRYLSSKVQLVRSGAPVRVIGEAWRWSTFRRWMNVAHVGSFHHRSLFASNRFDPSFRICGDYEFLLRWGEGLGSGFLDKVTAEMEIGGVSANAWKAAAESERAKRIHRSRTPLEARMDRCWAVTKASARRVLWY